MDTDTQELRGPVRLVATNSLWVAGFQGVFGDPCGVEIVAVSLSDALGLNTPEIVLIDSGSFSTAGSLRDVLERFRQNCPAIQLIIIGPDCDADDDINRDADAVYIERLILAGAKGFLKTTARPEEFSAALQWVRGGSIWAPRQVLSRLVQSSQSTRNSREGFKRLNGSKRDGLEAAKITFTPREVQVLGLLVAGQSNRDIGESLGIDPVTVKAHLSRIMRKAGVANRIELTMYALSGRRSTTSARGAAVIPGKEFVQMH